ncbi:MAG: hypothetical protein ABSF28_07775 [Terracidiphilus sp.]|jgi:hypothetical protein
MSTPVVTPVVQKQEPPKKAVSYADARREADAADLAVQDAERALAAAIAVRGNKHNAAAEIGWHESVDRATVEHKHNDEIRAKEHADACDRAHVREKDVKADK